MTHLEFNKENMLWEIIEDKTGNILCRASTHELACQIMDKIDAKLEKDNS